MKHLIKEQVQRLLSEKQFVEVPVRPSAIGRPSVAPSTRVGRYSVETVPSQGRPVAEPPAGLGGAFGFENIGNIAFDVPTNAGSTPAIDKVAPKRSVFKQDTPQISPFAEPAKPSSLEISLPTDNTSMSVSTIAAPSTMSMPTAATTLAPSASASVVPALMAAAIATPKVAAGVSNVAKLAQNPVNQPQGTPMPKNIPATGTKTGTKTPTNIPPTTQTGTPGEPEDKKIKPKEEIQVERHPVELLQTKSGVFDPGEASKSIGSVHPKRDHDRESPFISLDPSRHMRDSQLGHPATRMPFGGTLLARESHELSLKDLVRIKIQEAVVGNKRNDDDDDDKLTNKEIAARKRIGRKVTRGNKNDTDPFKAADNIMRRKERLERLAKENKKKSS